ncbi:odorant receptor 63a-like [Teleopsis dalmanni]|uniref:odorant receptor 63a-like n=1 Tax=Teleopsis dalmanni TaxID=139649 RepID=UPI0018CF5CA6|nr:odorant receptor 63a-like [Teleopsis dalmanni]
MLSDREIEALDKRNYQYLKEMVRISFAIGVNFTKPTFARESLRILNIFLILTSTFSLYSHWYQIVYYSHDMKKIGESICTAFQTIVSIIKMIYCLDQQRRMAALLSKVRKHEVLQQIEIFHTDFAIKTQLKTEIDNIMNDVWKTIRIQLIFYIGSCLGIMSNYYITAIAVNAYHQHIGTPNYYPQLPFTGMYKFWQDKGLQFPYYEIQYFLNASSLYISGFAAVSFDGLFFTFADYGVGLYRVLRMMVKYSTSHLVPEECRIKYLRSCVSHYNRTIEFLNEVDDIYKHVSLSQFLLSLVILGIVVFEMSISLESDKATLVRMLMYLSAAGYQVVSYCYNGQLLATESDKICSAFYECEWYNQSKEFKTIIYMMMIRTQRVFYFNISWFSFMTLATFMAYILKTEQCHNYQNRLLGKHLHSLFVSSGICTKWNILLGIIIVTSYVEHNTLRLAHRSALPQCRLGELGFQRVFLLADTPAMEIPIKRNLLEHEQRRFGDLLQGNFYDSYHNLSYKHIMGLRWASQECFASSWSSLLRYAVDLQISRQHKCGGRQKSGEPFHAVVKTSNDLKLALR